MKKEDLKGKIVTFLDKHGKMRNQKVINVVGKTLTVVNAVGEKTRIHPNKNKVFGVIKSRRNTRLDTLEEIEW